jgi:transcriptional antiterminator NusG
MTEEKEIKDDSRNIFAIEAEEGVYDETDKDSPRWYVIHTYSGHEAKVKQNIEKLVANSSEESKLKEKVIKVVVPEEDYVEVKEGQRKLKTRKTFPGYVLVKMKVDNESWYLVRNTQGVTGFVGHGVEPVALTKEEVRRMGIEKVYIELDINVGDSIQVIDGPFKGVTGVVEDVNLERETLKARISMFGRDTSVELVFDQVEQL